jgi:peptide/nickel transport system permease protein
MALYVLKRVLLMVPTFFAVSLVVFVILNFAPGNPAAVALATGDSQSGQKSSLAGQQRESYRLFKEQFNLDKPVLLNTRFMLRDERVRRTLADVLDRSGRVTVGRKIDAQEELEDWGRYAVPALLRILQADPERELRALASQRLVISAQRPLIFRSRGRLSEDERAQNQEIARENGRLLGKSFGVDDPAEHERATQAFWTDWFATSRARWDWSGSEKLGILLFDTRFAKYWWNLARLDFGISHLDKRPVLDKVVHKLRYSITLNLIAILLIYGASVPLGIWSATARGRTSDRVVTVTLFMLYSLPSFFVGVFLLNLLTRGTPWQLFPTSGFESLDTGHMTTLEYLRDVAWHVVLPILCLSYANLAVLSRYARTGLLDVIRSDYIRTARAKGLPEIVVIVKHAARNGMIPILTLLATLLPSLIGGSVVVEVIFGIPGMGLYMFESIGLRDYNAVMAVLLISCALTLVGMLISDLSYALVDPRITFS